MLTETMAEELDLDLDFQEDQNINKTEERIRNLSSKVKEKAQETATEREARLAAEARAEAAEKTVAFLNDFSNMASKFPNAPEYREAIQEKVLAGYSVEDATVAVLNAEGKLMPQEQGPIAPIESPIGGSASMPPLTTGERSASDMSLDEKRAALMEADQRGELAQVIKRL